MDLNLCLRSSSITLEGKACVSINGWKVVANGDFNGDGIPDLLWRRTNDTGEPRIWLLGRDGRALQDIGLSQPDTGWVILGVNFSNNGKTNEIFWRRANGTGEVRVWKFTLKPSN